MAIGDGCHCRVDYQTASLDVSQVRASRCSRYQVRTAQCSRNQDRAARLD